MVLQKKMDGLKYSKDEEAALKTQKAECEARLGPLQDAFDKMSARLSRLNFQYQDPVKGFDRSKVKGLVAKLVEVKDSKNTTALEVTAGSKLFNVVVDNQVTSKNLLDKGKLRQRVTIIPLNKVQSRTIPSDKVKAAQKEVGKQNAHLALSLVGYDEEVRH